MKFILNISRIFVGSLFIVSGLIKANDTLGFSYKLEEYFENGALAYRIRDWFGWDSFSLEWFMQYALLLAIIMCAAEIILGFAVLFGTKIKTTVYSLLGLTIMFFFLTLHTATCDETGTYNEVTTVAVGSAEHESMLVKMESNSGVTIEEETPTEITFVEEMPVQCVTDCGCFGDAMKGSLGRSLTPWESFMKDVILIIFIIPIFISRKKIKLNDTKDDILLLGVSILFLLFFSWVFNWYFPLIFAVIGYAGYYIIKKFTGSQWIIIGFVTLITIIFIYFTYNHLPMKDYRAYAEGKSIPEQMTLPPDAVQPIYENVLYYKNKNTGEIEEFTEANYPWDDEVNYEFHDRETKLIQAGDVAAITDFTITDADGYDLAPDFFNDPGYVFVLVAYDISETDKESFKKINTFVDQCFNDGHYFIGLSASLYDDVEDFRHEQQTMFDFYSCDAITLKTIVRANPGILLLKQGTIVAKWHYNDLPEFEEVKKEFIK